MEDDHFFRQVNIEFLIHELKDPVSIIETGTRILLEKQRAIAAPAPSQERTLQRILRNAHKTRELLNELLEVGRAQTACFHCRIFHPLEALGETLTGLVDTYAPELFEDMNDPHTTAERLALLIPQGIRLDATPAAKTVTIEQDEVKFRQIVGNLIKNALQYRRRHILIHLTCQHDGIAVAVRDDGPGIATMHQELIFQRYKQVSPCASVARSGHGLGLAVARLLARAMGGDITIESELGQGAVFRLTLPTQFPG